MTFITLTEAKKRGLCLTCYGSGKINYTSDDDVLIDDKTGMKMVNPILRYKKCPTCQGSGKMDNNNNNNKENKKE